MPTSFPNIDINQQNVWRFLGFGSSIVGFICFALGTSSHNLFGQWNLLKIIVYFSLSFLVSAMTLFVKNIQHSFQWVYWLKPQLGFWVLVLTSLYSYYDDQRAQGEAKEKEFHSVMSLISFGEFALMSWSLSKQVQPGFEVGVTNFFLGCLEVKVMKMSMKASVVVGAICLAFMSIRSCWYSRQGQGRRGGDDVHEEAPPIPSSLPLSMRPSPSVSTLRRRSVHSDSSPLLNTPSTPAQPPGHDDSITGLDVEYRYRCCGNA